jgi:hypothetical protein
VFDLVSKLSTNLDHHQPIAESSDFFCRKFHGSGSDQSPCARSLQTTERHPVGPPAHANANARSYRNKF